jgi:hypothetical protein
VWVLCGYELDLSVVVEVYNYLCLKCDGGKSLRCKVCAEET